MKNINVRLITLGGLIFLSSVCFNAFAGNGSGNEPPKKKKEKVTLACAIFGLCIETQGNGSGNEPPKS